ncbi:hypothetical protein SAMD00023353_5300760 [Rosellinia necatrix]|uniref:Uncharacterized protein n=1 Tax=Rosellinia necatrix TaxID=77044 RepID=A0A1S8A9X9_ROSNE|nr:hypothetical protein SAMD00023353_5300760 [Rosellinia necatrix]
MDLVGNPPDSGRIKMMTPAEHDTEKLARFPGFTEAAGIPVQKALKQGLKPRSIPAQICQIRTYRSSLYGTC